MDGLCWHPVTITLTFFYSFPLQIIVTHLVVVCKSSEKRVRDMSKKKGTKVLGNIIKSVNSVIVL